MRRILFILLINILCFGFAFSQTHFTTIWSGNGVDHMNFYVGSATINGIDLQIDDEVAVFDGSNCVGVSIVTSPGSYLSIKASKDDDVTPETDGYISGHSATIKIWDASEQAEITDANVVVTSGSIAFSPGGTCWINLTATVDCTPATPVVGTITQPTCAVSTGSVVLSNLPAGSWTITRSPGGTTYPGSGSSYTVTPLPAGDTYTFTVTNASMCTSDPSGLVTINAQPVVPPQPGNITGSATPCQGSSQTYSIATVSGATSYTWTLPSGWTGTSTSTSITTTVGANNGTVSVTPSNSCGPGTARTLNVTVSLLPEQPGTITGNSTPCQGSSQTYSIAEVTGATSYTWTLPSGWTGSSTSASLTTTVGANSGNVSVTANNDCGPGPSQTLGVTVSPLPAQPGTISGSTSPCLGSSQTYSIDAVTGATDYTWTLPSGWIGTSTSTSITTTVGANSGTVSVTANNVCGPGTVRNLTVSVSTAPDQPGTISGNSTPCEGSSQTYSITTVTGATSYTWTLPSGWTGSSTSTSITTTVGANSGTVSVTPSNSCGPGIARNLTVSVSTAPDQPGTISGSTSPCQGSSQTYSIASVSGATSYTWNLPNGWSGSSTSTSITATVGATSGSVSVTANNSCGPGPDQTLGVTVSPLPGQPGTITGSTSPCQGSSQTYSIGAVNGATSYTWNLPSGWTGNSTSTSITTTVGANNGTVSVTANNDCGPGTIRNLTVSVSTAPGQPGTISGNSTPCEGSSQTYSIATVNGATSYTWTLPSGWTGSSTSTSITTTVGANGGNVSVTANNNCGSSSARTLGVSVADIPTDPVVDLDQPDCDISTGTITVVSPKQSGMTYSINGSTYSNTSGIFTSVVPGTYSVTARNAEGCTSGITSATINSHAQRPATPVITIDDNTLQSNAANGNQWYNQEGLINEATGQNYTATADGNYYVIVTDNGCSSYPSNTINVVLTGLDNILSGNSIKIYPNPTTGRITLTFPFSNEQEAVIDILNMNGQILKTQRSVIDHNQVELRMESLSKGAYILRINYSGIAINKIVILK